jgi:hypothetical protein
LRSPCTILSFYRNYIQLLSAERASTYADMYAMLENEGIVAWLTPYAAFVDGNSRAVNCSWQLNEWYRFIFSVDGKE